ncbi:MAG: DUF4398 domain-containing protein [Rhodanobacteraceae bacterium]|nr:MAG: DUF4398 domain-containing protein [Rhodanobacteraceae bacterium]
MAKWYADNAPMHPGRLFMPRIRPKIHDCRTLGPTFAAAALAAVLAGCATAPPPIQLMDHAQTEILAARNAGAATAAPETLAESERRLAAAQELSAKGDNGKATDKAEEAEAAAATARARAEVVQIDQQVQQQTEVNQGLQADLERRQAAAAAAQQAALAPAPATSVGGPAAASSTAAPAAASTAATPAPVTLPSIQLGQPAVPPPAGNATPAAASSAGQPDSGVRP